MHGQEIVQEPAETPWALKGLPPFPWIATKVLQLFGSQGDDVEVKRLLDLIRSDAALGSELLRRANSPLYGFRSQIASLHHAVVLLGMNNVKTLAMTAGMSAYLKAALKLVVLRRCWRHSLTCALLSDEIAQACGIAPDQAYTAGLLHDIGRLVLLVKYPQPYADLLSVVIENRFALLASERDLFEVDHCEAGAWMARQWGFPEELGRVATKHHEPPTDGPFDVLRLTHLSCRLANSLGFHVAEPAHSEDPAEILAELPPRALSRIRFDLDTLKETLTTKVNALE